MVTMEINRLLGNGILIDREILSFIKLHKSNLMASCCFMHTISKFLQDIELET